MHIRSYSVTLIQEGKQIADIDLDAENKKDAYAVGKFLAENISLVLSGHYRGMGLSDHSKPPKIKVHVSNYQPKK
jgi:hypothetical protein